MRWMLPLHNAVGKGYILKAELDLACARRFETPQQKTIVFFSKMLARDSKLFVRPAHTVVRTFKFMLYLSPLRIFMYPSMCKSM